MMMHKQAQVNWGPALFLIIYQVSLLALLPVYFYFTSPTWGIVISSIVLLYVTGLSITGGYHRYYSHKSYRTGSIVEAILLFFGSMTVQGSALRWSFDHRLHHANVDTDDDPYSIKKGFWYAHCLWLLEKPRTIDPKMVSDLMKNKLVMFQHKHYKVCMIVSNALVVTFLGWVFADAWGALVIALGLRLFALHHFTWFINSLAHTWGDKPFCQELSAVDNYFLSMLTFGEGYHNYHHTFANDYRNGVRWYHFDPTKWLIWTLHKLGLAENLRAMDPITIQKRMVLESKNVLLARLKELCIEKKDEMEQSIHELSERIVAQLAHLNQLKEDYLSQRNRLPRDMIKGIKTERKQLRKKLRVDWQQFVALSKSIT